MKNLLTLLATAALAATPLAQSSSKAYFTDDFSLSANSNALVIATTSQGSRHSGGVNVCLADGSVRFLSESISTLRKGQTIRLRIAQVNNRSGMQTQNNLKQLGLAMHSKLPELKILALRKQGDRRQVFMEHTLKGVRLSPVQSKGKEKWIEIQGWDNAVSKPVESLQATFDPAKGVWYLRNSG